MFAISTAWNFNSGLDTRRTLLDIGKLGVDAIEIGYNITRQRLKELIALISDMNMRAVSVHNFCPLPDEAGLNRFPTDYYRLSSRNARERAKAVDFTKRSIDTCGLVSSRVLVVHAGTVELEHIDARRLLHLYNAGKFGSHEYVAARKEFLIERSKKSAAHLESVERSLEELLDYAHSAGVKIGLETRYYPNEIPNIDEAEYLLGRFKHKGLVYWHDTGHAETNQRLGITAHDDYLNRLSGYMLGIHLHDLRGIDDHMAPFSGDFDFSKLAPYLKGDVIKVIEAHSPATPGQLSEAIRRLSVLCQ